MHEMHITNNLIDIVRDQMAKNGIERLGRVRIRVGEMAAVKPEALRFSFNVTASDAGLDGAVLDIEEVPLTGRCLDCGQEFRMDGPLALCSRCKGDSVEIIAGREIDIVSIESHHVSSNEN